MHRIERVGCVHQCADADERESGDGGAQLEPQEVPDVQEDGLALLDGREDCREVIIEEDHVGGLLADVGAATHRDPHIRPLHRHPVVDAIAGHGHNEAVALERRHDPHLVPGAHPVEHLDRPDDSL